MESHSDASSSDLEKTRNIVDITADENSSSDSELTVRDIKGWKWITVVLAILSSTFLFALDNTITANIQAEIVRDFESVNKLSWISVGLVMSASATASLG